jgi:hypothetical protein
LRITDVAGYIQIRSLLLDLIDNVMQMVTLALPKHTRS